MQQILAKGLAKIVSKKMYALLVINGPMTNGSMSAELFMRDRDRSGQIGLQGPENSVLRFCAAAAQRRRTSEIYKLDPFPMQTVEKIDEKKE